MVLSESDLFLIGVKRNCHMILTTLPYCSSCSAQWLVGEVKTEFIILLDNRQTTVSVTKTFIGLSVSPLATMDTITLPWLYFPDTHLKTASMLIKQQLSISRDCAQSCQSSLCVSSFSLLSMACFIRWLTLLIIPQIFICIPARARTRARDKKWRLPFITPPLLIVLAYNVGSSACILLKENHFFFVANCVHHQLKTFHLSK